MPSAQSLGAAWLDGDDADAEAVRRKVAAFVVDCGALRGMSRKAVGRVFSRPDVANKRTLRLYLGPDSMELDAEELVVTFDRRGRAVDAAVHQG